MDALFAANRRVSACIVARNDDAQQTRIRHRRGQKISRQGDFAKASSAKDAKALGNTIFGSGD
jgi:hypothetical protein